MRLIADEGNIFSQAGGGFVFDPDAVWAEKGEFTDILSMRNMKDSVIYIFICINCACPRP